MTDDRPRAGSTVGQPPTLAILEGRVTAHRQVLAALIAVLPQDRRDHMLATLEAASVFLDGQEDPGAVPSPGLGPGLALAEECRLLREMVLRGAQG